MTYYAAASVGHPLSAAPPPPGAWAPGSTNTNRGATGLTGRVFYVSLAGSDSNDGLSEGAPVLTAGQADTLANQAGDSILFRGGDTWDVEEFSPRAGTSGAKVTIGSYGTGRATLRYGGTVPGYGRLLLPNTWNVWRDLIFLGTSQAGPQPSCQNICHNNVAGETYPGGGTVPDGPAATDVEWDNCEASNFGIGFLVGWGNTPAARWSFNYCTIHDCGGTGIYIYGLGHVVRNCLIYRTASAATFTQGQHGIYARAPDLVLEYCDISQVGGSGRGGGQLFSPRSRNYVCRFNRFHDTFTGSANGGGEAIGHFPSSEQDSVYGHGQSIFAWNTFYNLRSAVFGASNNGGSMTERFVFHNNYFHAISGTTAISWGNMTNGGTARNNVYEGTYTTLHNTPGGTLRSSNNSQGRPTGVAAPPAAIAWNPATNPPWETWVPAPSFDATVRNAGLAAVQPVDGSLPAVNIPAGDGSDGSGTYAETAPDIGRYEYTGA